MRDEARHVLDAGERQRLCKALVSLKTESEADAFLADILSERELQDLAQRLEVARLLSEGASYLAVSSATGASSTTVSRVSKCLRGAKGGYRCVLARLSKTET